MLTVPSVASYRRGTRPTKVDLPAPVEPMIAVVVPGMAVNEMCLSTGSSAPGYANVTSSKTTVPRCEKVRVASAACTTVLSVDSTSLMRSAETEARGISTNRNVAIITDMRI